MHKFTFFLVYCIVVVEIIKTMKFFVNLFLENNVLLLKIIVFFWSLSQMKSAFYRGSQCKLSNLVTLLYIRTH